MSVRATSDGLARHRLLPRSKHFIGSLRVAHRKTRWRGTTSFNNLLGQDLPWYALGAHGPCRSWLPAHHQNVDYDLVQGKKARIVESNVIYDVQCEETDKCRCREPYSRLLRR